jgi:CBS domain-containing protein
MDLLGKARRVRIYLSEGDKIGHQPAPLAIVEMLRRENAQGATVIRAVSGFGATGELHVPHLVDVAQDLPMIVEWIDTPQQVERLLPRVQEAVPGGLITVDDTEVVLHEPHRVRELPSSMTAGDLMSREVTAVAKDTPVRQVVELMLGKVYRAVPVVDAGAPVGIITNGDLVRKGGLGVRLELLRSLDKPELHATLERLASGNKRAADVMTPGPVAVEASAPLPRVAEIMAHRRLKRLPVVDEHGALAGMISRVDLLRVAAGGYERKDLSPREMGLVGDGPVSRVMRRDIPMVHPDTELPEVFQAIVSTRLNRVLVVDADRRVVGIITDAELLDRLTPSLRPGALRSLMHRLPFVHATTEAAEQHAVARRAADLMVREVPTVTEDTLLSDAIATMLGAGRKVLAVTDDEGHVTGIVDRADLLHGLVPVE